MDFGEKSKEEEKALAKTAREKYASDLDNQVREQARVQEKLRVDNEKRYDLGTSRNQLPPPTGNVWKEMRAAQTEIVKAKANAYQDALDNQIEDLRRIRATPLTSRRLLVASVSELKLRAVRDAFTPMDDVVGVDAASGVDSQPIGLDETFAGARGRLDAALRSELARKASVVIAIESGIVQVGGAYVDMSVVLAKDVKGGREATATSAGVQIPSSYIDQWRNSEKWATVGEVIAAEVNCNKVDPHQYLTQKHFERATLITEAVRVACSTLWSKNERFL
ncbi:hypothetical protein TeGR_g4265 [Tetraparma gracilis]|uniref:inosine/xanthosine triphosphatase n=1 Tax=Tetraparma gracilis TaxID=2962635 RepID=A0ABQ6MG52_9STRA|nr:hypothetical protein TeGR_g4265 [Tetraparma gracilis]